MVKLQMTCISYILFLFILLIESIVHKMFGGAGHGHSHGGGLEKVVVEETGPQIKIPR